MNHYQFVVSKLRLEPLEAGRLRLERVDPPTCLEERQEHGSPVGAYVDHPLRLNLVRQDPKQAHLGVLIFQIIGSHLPR
jgi:hypothetical protein